MACDKTVTLLDPINHIMVEIGLAKKPKGMLTTINPVYNCDVLNLANGKTKSSPFNLLMANTPAIKNTVTNNKSKLVINAYILKIKTIAM